jgi:MFS family permease
MTTQTETPADRTPLLRDRNFRWLTYGGAMSMLGDQFTLIALPWLVLQMTHDTRVLGTVLALIGIPRALFILVGGAFVDRYSPKSVLMMTKFVSTALLATLAAGVFTATITVPIVYALSLAIGLASAFSIPSATSMLPRAVQPHNLAAANGAMLGLRQFSMFLGPVLGGLMIALSGDSGSGVADARGLAIAFALDALSFALSAWTLSKVSMVNGVPATETRTAVGASIMEGLRYVWRDAELRTCYLYWAAIAMLVMGPLHIALPVLASEHMKLGAAALGIMLGAHGAGTLVGMAISGARPGLRLRTLGLTLLAIDVVTGLLFMPLGQVGAAWQGATLLALIGVLGGFVQVSVFTWLQRRVPPSMLGRAMSLFMFIFMGLVPMSSAATGWLMQFVTLGQLFAGCGGLLVLVAAVAFFGSPMPRMTEAAATPAAT